MASVGSSTIDPSTKMVAVIDEPATVVDEPPAVRGRPRSKEFDEAILRATLELAGELGIRRHVDGRGGEPGRRLEGDDLPAVAVEGGLVLDALQTTVAPLDDVDTGEVVEDLRQYLLQLIAKMRTRERMNDVLPHLIEKATHDPAIRSAVDDYMRSRRAPMRVVIERGLERDQLPSGIDVEILLDALSGPCSIGAC